MPTTSPDNISYPSNADEQKTIEERIQDTAESVQEAFNTRPLSHNYIINGGFDINQRNLTSSGTSTFGYTGFDRWVNNPSTGTVVYSAQDFSGPDIIGEGHGKSYIRVAVSGQSAVSAYATIQNRIEDVRVLSNKTVTISWWARAATGSPSMAIELKQIHANGTNDVNFFAGKVTISTDWNRYSVTYTLPSVVFSGVVDPNSYTEIQMWCSAGSNYDSRTGSLGVQNNTFDIWGVQLEEGSVATPFRRNSNSLQAELAACQRHYWRTPLRKDSGKVPFFAIGPANTTGQISAAYVQLPVQMRDVPYAIDYAGTIQVVYPAVNAWNATSIALTTYATPNAAAITVNIASGSINAGQTYFVRLASNDAYIGFSADL